MPTQVAQRRPCAERPAPPGPNPGGSTWARSSRTYEDFYDFWPKQAANSYTDALDRTRKHVVSSTLREPLAGESSTLIAGDVAGAVARLKDESDGDVRVLGSGELLRSLMPHGLVDRHVLMIHPLVLGTGIRLFPADGVPMQFTLADSVTTSKGVVTPRTSSGRRPRRGRPSGGPRRHTSVMRMRLGMALTVLATVAAAGAADASTLIYVCGRDLCTSDDRGHERERLTRDGARAGGYSRPTIDRAGRRIAFKVGDPGRVFTADARARRRTRIPPAPDGARDATQFDAAISPDGRRVAWVETRINVTFGGSDFRRYVAGVRGASPRQVASNGGRPFVGWFDPLTIVREGPPAEVPPLRPDQSLCLPDPATATNGVCGRVIARDPARNLRHPSVSPDRRFVVATAYTPPGDDDLSIDHAGAIVLFNAATGAVVRELTRGPGDRGPVFSPDGRSVAFERSAGIWRVPAAGGRATRVIRSGRQPAWGR